MNNLNSKFKTIESCNWKNGPFHYMKDKHTLNYKNGELLIQENFKYPKDPVTIYKGKFPENFKELMKNLKIK